MTATPVMMTERERWLIKRALIIACDDARIYVEAKAETFAQIDAVIAEIEAIEGKL